MFQRKVHPENSSVSPKSDKHQKNENKKKIIKDGDHNKSEVLHPEEDIMLHLHPKRTLAKESMRHSHYKSQSNPPQFTFGSEDSSENREHWIRTDADCKYTIIVRTPIHRFSLHFKWISAYIYIYIYIYMYMQTSVREKKKSFATSMALTSSPTNLQ